MMTAAQQQLMGELVNRRSMLEHAAMYLNKAFEYDLAAKVNRMAYDTNQRIQELTKEALK